jgi:HEAT repeat protein
VPLGVAEVSLRPLAALFKLADALHTDYRRVSRQVVELGGKQAEDNPKTRFRLRVRGWVFDDQGRIELYAVPKDWDDVAVIHTGFEKTRQELEPVIPTLRDAGFPWELALRPDETDLEHEAGREIEAERRVERAFVGMDYFTEADAPHFKGRDDDARALRERVMAVPVTLLVGESGVGKTSLIYAGLFPLLHQARWRTACIRPFDDPDRFVVRDLWRALPELESEPSTGATIAEALARAGRAVGDRKLLVVLDQFEDVACVALPEMLDGVRKALVAVQAGRFRNLRLLVSYRADAEAALGPFFQEVSSSDRGLPRTYLQPLSRAGARAALEAGFAQAQVGVSDRLLDTIADELEVQTSAAGIYPPYVQMAGETLCRAARAENESILTEELYREKGGCEGIIGRYLLQRLAEFGEWEEAARRVLVALVRSTGVKGQRPFEELQAETGLDAERLAQVLAGLVDRRMVRHLGGGEYEIVHDHLASLVDREIVSAQERELKELQEFLELRARAYARHPVLLQPVDMARLYEVRERISPNDEQMRLLLHSCLAEQGPAWFWLRDAPKARVVSLLRDALVRPISSLRRNAASALAQVAGPDAIPDLRKMLQGGDESVQWTAAKALAQVLQQMGRDAIPDLREMLKDEDGGVQRAAAKALAQILQQMGQDAIPDLREMLKGVDERVRRAAVQALAQVAGRDAIPDLREMLEDEDEGVRWEGARALAQILQQMGRDAIPDLRKMLKDGEMFVRGVAAEALAQVAGRDAIPDLREMLKDEHGDVQQAAVWALAQVAGRDEIPDLREMLKDGDWRMRRAAVEALAQILRQMGQDAIPDLREMLKDENRDVRGAAAQALAQILRQMGQDAIPDLREMLKDENGDVRGAAMRALQGLVTENDLVWLVEWAIHYPLAQAGTLANRLLIHLDRTLYFPT